MQGSGLFTSSFGLTVQSTTKTSPSSEVPVNSGLVEFF